MFNFSLWLMVFLTLLGSNNGQQPIWIAPDDTFSFMNIGYPANYLQESSYQWTFESDGPLRLTCDPFNIPFSYNQCEQERLVIWDSNVIGRRYCNGQGSLPTKIDYVSQYNRLTAILVATEFSRGGSFHCTVMRAPPPCECGRKKVTRIVGGRETGINEYPMMAAVVDPLTVSVLCGATIISIKQVLTAAHCVATRLPSDTGILVGDHNVKLGKDTNSSRVYPADYFSLHLGYNSNTLDNDIALVTVRDIIVFSQEVGRVCLPFQHVNNPLVYHSLDVLGWGAKETAGIPSPVLMKVSLGVISNEKCKETNSDVTQRQICTQETGKDSCQFDSGGPLLWENYQKVTLIGIVSSGHICGEGEPAENTRVTEFLNWIVRNTPRGIEYCRSSGP